VPRTKKDNPRDHRKTNKRDDGRRQNFPLKLRGDELRGGGEGGYGGGWGNWGKMGKGCRAGVRYERGEWEGRVGGVMGGGKMGSLRLWGKLGGTM